MSTLSPLLTGKYLTPAEEAELGRALVAGRGDDACDEQIAAAKAARDELVVRNTAFAIRKAVDFRRFYPELNLDDLVGQAILGLIDATGRWNPERARYTTCAGFSVRRRLGEALTLEAMVHIPQYLKSRDKRARPEFLAAAARICRAETGDLVAVVDERSDAPDVEPELADDLERLPAALALLDERPRAIVTRYFNLDGRSPERLGGLRRRLRLSDEGVHRKVDRILDEVRAAF
ncbi:hypothetical protein [Paludisphaera mucosa]|uniref:Uncharacterized protein n=1 Tax=Paludisphaera mucosa TaxID=3030827 RepID=A0ABT6F781_9BACT|nr:hypothetical protein [Paludisphaera mucosa]MDG3003274.1 hypothetical protein [Paludisphaera mucosa]